MGGQLSLFAPLRGSKETTTLPYKKISTFSYTPHHQLLHAIESQLCTRMPMLMPVPIHSRPPPMQKTKRNHPKSKERANAMPIQYNTIPMSIPIPIPVPSPQSPVPIPVPSPDPNPDPDPGTNTIPYLYPLHIWTVAHDTQFIVHRTPHNTLPTPHIGSWITTLPLPLPLLHGTCESNGMTAVAWIGPTCDHNGSLA